MEVDYKERIKKKEADVKLWKVQLERLDKARVLVIDQIQRAEGAITELKELDKDKDKEKEN